MMNKCKTTSEMMKEAREAGYTPAEMKILQRLMRDKKAGALDPDMQAEGNVSWYLRKEAGPLDAPVHVGSRSKTAEKYQQMKGEGVLNLYKMKNAANLKTVMLEGMTLDKWSLETVKEALAKQGLDSEAIVREEDISTELDRQGYDGILYDDGMYLWDTYKTDIGRVGVLPRKELTNKDFEKVDIVLGNDGESNIVDMIPTYKNIVMDRLDGWITLDFRENGKQGSARVLGVTVDMATMATIVQTSKGTFVYAQGSPYGRSTGNEMLYVRTEQMRQITEQFVSSADEDAMVESYLLGSESTDKSLWKDENEVEGTTDAEKAKKLIEQLQEIDPNATSDEMVTEYQKLVDMMGFENIGEMVTYLETNVPEGTKGRVVPGKINIKVSNIQQIANNTKSAAEVYVHELIHAYTMYGLRNGGIQASRIRRQLRYLRSQMAKVVTVESLMPKESRDPVRERENAEKMYDYVFRNESEAAMDEFIAHVLTNKELMDIAKNTKVREKKEVNTFFDRITQLFEMVLDLMRGKYTMATKDATVYEDVLGLTLKLGEINNEALVERNERQNPISRVQEWITEKELNFSDAVEKKLEELETKLGWDPLPKNPTRLQYAKWLVKYIPSLIMKDELRPVLGEILTNLGMKPEGMVQNVLRDFRTPEQLERLLDKLGMAAGKIERLREDIALSVRENLEGAFEKKLTTVQERDITNVMLELDMQSIWDEYTSEQLQEMLTSEYALNSEIKKVKDQLKAMDKEWGVWMVNQAQGLGYYMATGKAKETQLLNSDAIAGVVTEEVLEREVSAEMVKLVDKLATLSGVKYSEVGSRNEVAKLLTEEKEGMANVVAVHRSFVKDAKERLFAHNPLSMIKGYTKELTNDGIVLEVADKSRHEEMLANGYEKVYDLREVDGVMGAVDKALYKAKTFGRQEYYRHATRLTSTSRKGTTLTSMAFKDADPEYGSRYAQELGKRNVAAIENRRKKMSRAMKAKELDPVVDGESTLVPVLGDNGQVLDYRIMMSKEMKESVLEQDKAVTKVLSRSKASSYDKVATTEHNKEIMRVIEADMEENYVRGNITGNNGAEYMVIGPNSIDEMAKEIWKVLPSDMKRRVLEMENKEIAVRRDMVLNYFGFRHLSVANTSMARMLPKAFRTILKSFEELWQALVSIAKVNILIRIPTVIIGNLLSNFMFGVMTGSGPITLAKMYVEEARNIREYMTMHKEYMSLVTREEAQTATQQELDRMVNLRVDMKANPIHELFEAGIYESIIEDLNDEDARTSNALGKWVQEKLEGAPGGVQTAWNWMTLNEKTWYYQNMEMMLRMGDLLGQATENKKRKVVNEKRMKEIEKQLKKDGLRGDGLKRAVTRERKRLDKERLESVSDDFIYYSKPSSAIEEYMNKMGLMMFTKYAKRIQRITGKTMLYHPIRTLAVMTGDTYLFNDGLETIMDQTVLDRSWYNFGISPFRIMESAVPVGVRMLY